MFRFTTHAPGRPSPSPARPGDGLLTHFLNLLVGGDVSPAHAAHDVSWRFPMF